MLSRNSSPALDNLIRQAQRSGERARDAKALLVSIYRPMLMKHTHAAPVALWEDAYQAACVGFLRAIRACDPSRVATFGAFAQRYVRGAVIKETKFHISEPNLIEDDDMDHDGALDEDLQRIDVSDRMVAVQVFVQSLPDVQRRVVVEVFWRDRSQADVARELSVSRAAVRRTLTRVYAKGRREVMFTIN